MPEITRRRTGELLRTLFEILKKNPDGVRARDALKSLAEQVALSEYERGFFASGGQRFEKIVRFATVDCVKAGWMTKNKGIWSLTDAGAQAFQSIKDPEAFYARATRLYREWKASQPDSEPDESSTDAEDSEA